VLRKRAHTNLALEPAPLQKEHIMKKNILIILAVLLASSFATLAAVGETSSDALNVNTAIQGQNEILVSTSALSISTWASNSYTERTITSTEVGNSTSVGYVNVKSNNRSGYELAVTATPLTSGAFTIDYALAVGSAGFDTASTTNAGNKITVTSLTGLTVTPYEILVTVDKNDYDNQPSGDYSGDITFNYTAK